MCMLYDVLRPTPNVLPAGVIMPIVFSEPPEDLNLCTAALLRSSQGAQGDSRSGRGRPSAQGCRLLRRKRVLAPLLLSLPWCWPMQMADLLSKVLFSHLFSAYQCLLHICQCSKCC